MSDSGSSAWLNVTPEWQAGIRESLRLTVEGESAFRWMHTGDSIATGVIGIPSPHQHYVAVAAALAGRRWGVPARRGFLTSGLRYSDGRVRLIGTAARSDDPGATFGARSWWLRSGGGGELRFAPRGRVDTISIVHVGGGFLYRSDGDWVAVPVEEGRPGRLTIDVPHFSGTLRIVASEESDARIQGFEAYDSVRPPLTWHPTGVGGARTTDLHRALGAKGGLGYAMYGLQSPSLLTIGIGVNDTIHADVETIEGSAGAMRLIVAQLMANGVGSIALVGPPPVRRDFQPGPWFVEDAYTQVLLPVALEFGLPLLDVNAAWQSYGAAQSKGYVLDQVHPTARGHQSIARALLSLLE